MKKISMNIIAELIKTKEANKISTKAAMDKMIESGFCAAEEMAEPSLMDALIRGIKLKKEKSKAVKKPSTKAIETLIKHIEEQSGCAIASQARANIHRELEAAYKLNGEIAQSYIDNLIRLYKHIKKEAAAQTEPTA